MDFNRELSDRIKGVQRILREKTLDALTVSSESDLRYIYGVESGRGVITRRSCILWVRDLYLGVYENFFNGVPYEVREYVRGGIESYFKRSKPARVGFEDVSYNSYKSLKKRFKLMRPVCVDIVGELRKIKSPLEVSLMEKSAKIACAGMKTARKVVKDGVSELHAVAEIEAEIRRRGSESAPFDAGMILASGKNGADIHAHPSFKKIGRGPVVVDLGAKYRGYHSDMTRTLSVGNLTKTEKKIIEEVENIKDEAIDACKPGVLASEVCTLAQKRIEGLGYKFYHFLGHGVGISIHEAPSLSPDSKEILCEGMVFTIEPGIYIPKKFGSRFEDTLLLTKNGAKVLTRF